MPFVVYVLCAGVGYLAGNYLPASAATPYIPVLVSYHLFVLYLIMHVGVTGVQKIGLSMSVPMAIVGHLCFVGAMIGMVLGREKVPLFGLLQYVVPGLAPFEVRWLFERPKTSHVAMEPENMPQGTHDDYAEFTEYLRGKRKFQRAGRTANEEFSMWRADREKQRKVAAAQTTSA
ncbi:hypothetical protein [Occallatibacter riparius]|uniref:Uncharacterized protein n=1 Tax=Occallatibacter riparius TaxID=1002689 RepID=A0A9J7BJH9_9BACT|nr:hypothetical protein [Occallatibacter riparius]UWZ82691.1 hypothetical protein MOP44_19225 [Occallatibacter riparius]